MTFSELHTALAETFGDDAFLANTTNPQPYLTVPADRLVELARLLRNDERFFFDLLACITALDNGPTVGTMEVIYNLTSIPYGHDLMLRVVVPRNQPGQPLPVVPSLSGVWRTADWHEREAFDLVGIHFAGHPDLRRILLPTDWVGHPLRTDYQDMEQYHGIRTE